MFLFDKTRHSRQNHKAFTHNPTVKWKTDLRTNPIYGAESTAVIDNADNIYFGSHSGNFYSLDKSGKIRWTFSTSTKIYSSPILIDSSVIFAGGDGYLYRISCEGELLWKFDLSKSGGKMFKKKTLNKWSHLPYTYDFHKKKIIDYKCWSSPNIFNNLIYITGYGVGLYCIDLNGKEVWSYDLGFPRYQLSGVAIDDEGRIYCSSRSGTAYAFSKEGKLLWKTIVRKNWENWGNPVFCREKNQVFYFFSKNESRGLIYSCDNNGKFLWQQEIGAIRASCAISQDLTSIYCCDLDGFLYKLGISDGLTKRKIKLTNAQRGLWITPTIDASNNILISTKDSKDTGRIILLNEKFDLIWQFENGKILSIPVVNKQGEILFGSWDGHYYCIN
ncbi:outer membrane protein assembly factor BamB family protein [Mongoliitalea daihaiensis]|uniref:outer membrane protein assembly factor BamB family protein n=1 Tax=Mongoliitalea daihaiensis TaxID=2782006 RepID=UPI001F38EFA3|nr:PQQ-binding-like beta-propeller repeat protein [Mongoliitalea daihaiensis]UJP64907.1 PQQ-binding-like beta-propeller repeat protein [Mongoliitalea daihaiensis]